MYERFTDRARKVMGLANQERQRFNQEYIDTEHILMGLVKEGSGIGANVLKNLDVNLRNVRSELDKNMRSGPDTVLMGEISMTPAAKKVIEYGIAEARNLNHNYNGTEHLLLGLCTPQDDSLAFRVLTALGLKLEEVREEVLNLLGTGVEPTESVARSWRHPSSSVNPLPRYRQREKPVKIDLESGSDLDLADLPEDVTYGTFLAKEMSKYAFQREARNKVVYEYTEAQQAEIDELNEQIEKASLEKDEAVRAADYERAAELVEEMEARYRKIEAIRAQSKVVKDDGPVELSDFACIHLALFRAEDGLVASRYDDVYEQLSLVMQTIEPLLASRISDVTSSLQEKLQFLEGVVDEQALKACRERLGHITDDPEQPLIDRMMMLGQLQSDIQALVTVQDRIVTKANVFEHGTRDEYQVNPGDTVTILTDKLREKYVDQISQYLHARHGERVPSSEVRIRVFVTTAANDGAKELKNETLLTDIPERDIEGVTWYPEWRRAKSDDYTKEIQS